MNAIDIERLRSEWERGLPIQRSPYGTFAVYADWRQRNPAPGWANPPKSPWGLG